jgi:CheY-like chemotaxis protein
MTAPATILIVDDESTNRRLLQALLGPEGYVTRSAASGRQALDCIADDPPDLILLDVMMPGLDGRQVARAVKADPANRHIPIIMVTAQSNREARLAALEAGAEDFLSKPIDRAELWLRVRNLLRLKELGDLLENHKQSLEADVQARTAELLVANEAIRGFTAAAAHDLRTPLTSIVGFSALLTKNWETRYGSTRTTWSASWTTTCRTRSSTASRLRTSGQPRRVTWSRFGFSTMDQVCRWSSSPACSAGSPAPTLWL